MSIDTPTKPKILELEYKVLVKPGVLEYIPEDPVLFDALLKSMYKEILKLPKPVPKSEVAITVRLSAYDKFESIEEFKTVQHQKNVGIFDILTKHKIINGYQLEFGTKQTLLKRWGQRDGMYPEIQMPYYYIHCQLLPAVFSDYVIERFVRHKTHFQEVADIYSRMIKILEEFFANPTVFNLTLNNFFQSLVARFNELLNNDIRPTLAMDMALPLNNLMLEQEQIVRVTKDPNWLFKPMYDHYTKLQQFISMYDLRREQNLNFEQIDEYLQQLKAAREQGLDLDGRPLKQTTDSRLITNLTLIRTATNSSLKIVVNNDYNNPFKVSLNKAPWKLLLRVAEGENPLVQNISSLKSTMEYLNFHSDCKLYTQSGKQLTKIIEDENGRLVPAVAMEVISPQAFQQRLNKLKST